MATFDNLLKPTNNSKLAGILAYHFISGKLNAKEILEGTKKGVRNAFLTIVQRGSLTVSVVIGKVVLTKEKGGKAKVTTTDLKATNGVIHVVKNVLIPM